MDAGERALDRLYNVILDVRAEFSALGDPTVDDVENGGTTLELARDEALRAGADRSAVNAAFFRGYSELVAILGAAKPDSVWRVDQSKHLVIGGTAESAREPE